MSRSLVLALIALVLAVPQAYAGMIRPGEDPERERVKALLERADVRAGLEKHGVVPEEAAARVDAMTPAEVRELSGRIDAVAAGGQTTDTLLLLIILILLIVILV